MNPATTFAVCTAPKRDSFHWRPGTVTWAEICEWAENPGNKKEAGNYLLGDLAMTTVAHKGSKDSCYDVHRRKDAVVSRSAITLDVDYPDAGFADNVELTFPHAALVHTTFSSSPDELRYRLIVPTDRDMKPDEYITAAESLMQLLGVHQFDKSTTQPERYMFKPAAQRPEWYDHFVLDGAPAPVEELLASFEADLSTKPMPLPNKTKRDPFEIEGVVGAFNRAYESLDLLIETYELPYERVDDDRYHLVGAASQAGMGPVQGVAGLFYSHHSNDPAYGKTCSAFDLVRLHMFGELDENASDQTPIQKLPSHGAMLDLATTDHRVTAEIVGVDFDAEMDDDVAAPNSWRIGLRVNRNGKVTDVIQNWDLIVENDPIFGLLYFNELSLGPEFSADVPWRAVNAIDRLVTNTDRWEIVNYLEREYGLPSTKQKVDAMIDTKAGRTTRNPVREYLDDLVWDKQPRLEECLPGVKPTEYTRMVARKSMVAAVARMFDPGCKWDHTLVLFGNEGLGKSWWIHHVARGFSGSLGRIDNKDTLLAMQRSWIMLADEGHSLRKGDADQLKEFLTRTEDMFRMPYDRETVVHKRHCVIWSATNDETFLRRQEGNRRFLIVHCEEKVDFDQITDAYVDQLWAEAVYLYRAGERLFLDEVQSITAHAERERYVEEDALAGLIEEYLETLVPADWWERSPESRQQWLTDRAHGFVNDGVMQIDRTCSTQIWVEAMGRRVGDSKRVDLLDITNTLKRIPGWKATESRQRIPGYGPQLMFIREDLL